MEKFLIRKSLEEEWTCIQAFFASTAMTLYIIKQTQLWPNNNIGQIIIRYEADKDGWAIEETYYIRGYDWCQNLIDRKVVNVRQLDWKNGF